MDLRPTISALPAVLDPFTRNLVEQALMTGIFLSLAFGSQQRRGRVFCSLMFILSNLFECVRASAGEPAGDYLWSSNHRVRASGRALASALVTRLVGWCGIHMKVY